MKLRPTKRRLLRAALVLCVLAYIGYGVTESSSSAGHVVFHVGYSLPVSRPLFLRYYHYSLRKFDGGYLPSSIDEFLCTRLRNCEGTSEWQAIIDFQIRQGSGRWGDGLSRTHDEMKRKIIGDIIHRLDTFSPDQAVNALVLVESLRRGNALHKGGFATRDLWTGEGTTFILRMDRLAVAKDAFRRWWADGSAWPYNKIQDPLSGTGIAIHEGP